ncbi:hypothetical protein V6Z11_A05G402700 [Gossypium hirsutum]
MPWQIKSQGLSASTSRSHLYFDCNEEDGLQSLRKVRSSVVERRCAGDEDEELQCLVARVFALQLKLVSVLGRLGQGYFWATWVNSVLGFKFGFGFVMF